MKLIDGQVTRDGNTDWPNPFWPHKK